jgi:hypothetical protein
MRRPPGGAIRRGFLFVGRQPFAETGMALIAAAALALTLPGAICSTPYITCLTTHMLYAVHKCAVWFNKCRCDGWNAGCER